jgi:hypothetical protein
MIDLSGELGYFYGVGAGSWQLAFQDKGVMTLCLGRGRWLGV